VYEEGHDIEPPLLADSQVPYATVVIFRKDLNGCEGAPQPQAQTQSEPPVSVTPHPFFPWIPEYSSIASSFPKFNPDQLSTQGLGHSRKRDRESIPSESCDYLPQKMGDHRCDILAENGDGVHRGLKRARRTLAGKEGYMVERVREILPMPVVTLIVGVVLGAYYPNIMNQVCHSIA